MIADWIADWICGFTIEQAGRAAIEKTKDHLIDFIGVLLAGAAEEESARTAFEYVSRMGGRKDSTLFERGGGRLPSESVAFAHASAAHSIEMDDVHNASSLHPAVAVIPAALAVAEEFQRSGGELIEAMIAGYEVILRIGEAANPSAIYARNFHPTAVCGVFSSAAAAGKLMKLTPEQMTNALGLAWSFASGNMSFQTEGSWAKRLQIGNTARAGVQAARLALLGATGPKQVFSDTGFFQGYSGEFHSEKMTDGLGERLKILETGIKPYACCRYNQAPVDGLLELRRADKISADNIERIEIEIASTGLPLVAIPAEEKRTPSNSVAAQFSLYYSSAVAVVAGAAGREEYRDPWLNDTRVLQLAQRVNTGSSQEIDAIFPKKWATRIRIQTKSGERIDHFATDCLGDPEKPMSRGQIVEKFCSLASGSLSEVGRSNLVEQIVGLETLSEASALARTIVHGFGPSI